MTLAASVIFNSSRFPTISKTSLILFLRFAFSSSGIRLGKENRRCPFPETRNKRFGNPIARKCESIICSYVSIVQAERMDREALSMIMEFLAVCASYLSDSNRVVTQGRRIDDSILHLLTNALNSSKHKT